MVDVEDLVTSGELARRLGVVPSTVANWRSRHPNFPKPYGARGGKGGVYVLSEVEVWLANRGEPIPPTPIGGRLDAYTVTTNHARLQWLLGTRCPIVEELRAHYDRA